MEWKKTGQWVRDEWHHLSPFYFHQVNIHHHWADNSPFQNWHISGWHVACMCLGHVTFILIHHHVPLLVQVSSKLLFPEGVWFTDFGLSICNTSSAGTLQWLAKHARWPMSGVTVSPVSNTDTGLSVTPLMGHLACLASHRSVPVTTTATLIINLITCWKNGLTHPIHWLFFELKG